MDQFDREFRTKLKAIQDEITITKIKKSLIGRRKFKDEIKALKEKIEFKTLLNNWIYRNNFIYNTKLWKNHELDFFNLENSYFILNTEEDFNEFKEFLEKECEQNIQQQKTDFSESDINSIYKNYLEELNPTNNKNKIIEALTDVCKNKIHASYENFLFITKKIHVNISKEDWYSKLGLSDDQVSITYNRHILSKKFPEYKNILMNIAIGKFKHISNKNVSDKVKISVLKTLEKNPTMSKDQIESYINSYEILTEDSINKIFTELKLSWNTLNLKDKKEISFKLHKIKERINI